MAFGGHIWSKLMNVHLCEKKKKMLLETCSCVHDNESDKNSNSLDFLFLNLKG